jgi:hypothetical protein
MCDDYEIMGMCVANPPLPLIPMQSLFAIAITYEN